MSYFRSAIDAMTGYVPGEQPKPGTKIIKLNSNENLIHHRQWQWTLHNLDSEWFMVSRSPAREFCNAVSEALGVPAD